MCVFAHVCACLVDDVVDNSDDNEETDTDTDTENDTENEDVEKDQHTMVILSTHAHTLHVAFAFLKFLICFLCMAS